MTDELTKCLAEILDSKTAQKVYDDGLTDAVSETGSAITDVVKTARLFTVPFQLAAAYQDRLQGWIDQCIRKVPEGRRVVAPARIAGPIFEELKYLDDGDVISVMYLNLLSKAIDKEKIEDAHPAFVKIIGHLSPDEALMLHHLGERSFEQHYHFDYDRSSNKFNNKEITLQEFPTNELTYPDNFYIYTSHLISLDLVSFPVYKQEPTFSDNERRNQDGENGFSRLQLTEFGQMFVKACEPSAK